MIHALDGSGLERLPAKRAVEPANPSAALHLELALERRHARPRALHLVILTVTGVTVKRILV